MNRIYGLLGCAALVACGSQTLNLGGTNADSTNGSLESADGGTASVLTGHLAGGPGSTIPGASLCTIPPSDTDAPEVDAGVSLAPLVGNWSGQTGGSDAGYTEQATVLAFAATDGGPAGGTMTFGTDTLAPAVDPNISYPPSGYSSASFPFDGFAYTATQVSFDGATLSLALVPGELWKGWCGLQTPYSWEPSIPGCGCAPDWAGGSTGNNTYNITNPSTGDVVAMTGDFGIFGECNEPGEEGPPCVCSSAGCTIDMGSIYVGTIDLTLTPGHLDGTLSFAGDIHTSSSSRTCT